MSRGRVELLQQRAEGVVLVVVGFQDLLLHLRGEFAERAVSIRLEAQREEIQAMADQFVATDARLPGGWNADDQIVLAGEAVEQRGE